MLLSPCAGGKLWSVLARSHTWTAVCSLDLCLKIRTKRKIWRAQHKHWVIWMLCSVWFGPGASGICGCYECQPPRIGRHERALALVLGSGSSSASTRAAEAGEFRVGDVRRTPVSARRWGVRSREDGGGRRCPSWSRQSLAAPYRAPKRSGGRSLTPVDNVKDAVLHQEVKVAEEM